MSFFICCGSQLASRISYFTITKATCESRSRFHFPGQNRQSRLQQTVMRDMIKKRVVTQKGLITMFDQMDQNDLLQEDQNKTVPLVRASEGVPTASGIWSDTVEQPNGFRPELFAMLIGVGGVLTGSSYSFMEEETRIGVDPAQCQIVLPLGTPGVSRRHLRFWLHEGCPSAMDLGSTYGTTLNGQPMKPGLVYALKTGDLLKLGSHEEFQVE